MCYELNFDPAPSRSGREGIGGAGLGRRASLRGLWNMFSSFFVSGSGGSYGVVFCVIFPPPQREHAKEFRDRTFNVLFFMLCKIVRFIKSPKSSAAAFTKQGEKACISAVKLAVVGANKISPTDDGKTICQSSYSEWPTKLQSKSATAGSIQPCMQCTCM